MKKSELKTGMTVTLRNEDDYIVMLNTERGDILLAKDSSGKLELGHSEVGAFGYSDNLVYKDRDGSRFDIMQVYSPIDIYYKDKLGTRGVLLWDRKSSFLDTIKPNDLILVFKDKRWIPRYFHAVSNGKVYVWADGATSYTGYKRDSYELNEVRPHLED